MSYYFNKMLLKKIVVVMNILDKLLKLFIFSALQKCNVLLPLTVIKWSLQNQQINFKVMPTEKLHIPFIDKLMKTCQIFNKLLIMSSIIHGHRNFVELFQKSINHLTIVNSSRCVNHVLIDILSVIICDDFL